MYDDDKILELNRKYFSNKKDEVNIMADLGNCVKRLIFVLIVKKILEIAATGYDPDYRIEEKATGVASGKSRQITSTYVDKYNYASLQYIHSMLMDALVVSLRTLFYCHKQSSTAGSFVMEIANLKNLKQLNEVHFRNVWNGKGYGVGSVTKNDIKRGSIWVEEHFVDLSEKK